MPSTALEVQSIRGVRASLAFARLLRDPVGMMVALSERAGEIVVLHGLRGSQTSLFRSSRFNRRILSDTNVFRSRGTNTQGPEGSAQARIRQGLISMNGAEHQAMRGLLAPSFARTILDDLRPAIERQTAAMLDSWSPGETRDLYRDMHHLALDVTAAALFGDDDLESAHRVGRLIQRWLELGFSPRVVLLQYDAPGTPYRRQLRLAEEIEQAILGLIDRRRDLEGEGPFSRLLAARREGRITTEQLVGQTNVLFAAAHDTNTNALAWTLFLLSQHPEVMRDLHDELSGELRGEIPRANHLVKLPLLDRVIKESLRVLPPVPWLTRIVDQTTRVGACELPKGSRLYLSPYLCHREPERFPRPQVFDPDRWLACKPSAYEYLPFGAGPRMCIGYAVSQYILKLTLAQILQRYRLDLVPGARVDRKASLTLHPKRGLPMRVHRQDGAFARSLPTGNIHEMVDLT